MKLEALKQVKDALAKNDVAHGLDHYLVQNGRIYASNSRVLASTVWYDAEHNFLVPGKDFEKALDKLGNDCVIKVAGDKVKLSKQRLSATLPSLPVTQFPTLLPDADVELNWIGVPLRFTATLRNAREFISDNALKMFAMCLRIRGGKMYATNNVSVVEFTCEGLSPDLDVQLPCWAVDFILANEDAVLKRAAVTDRNASFVFGNGLEMRCQLVTDVYPDEQVDNILKNVQSTEQLSGNPFTVDTEWLAQLAQVAELSDPVLTLYADRVTGSSNKGSEIAADLATDIGENNHTFWDSRYLLPVLKVASAIDFSTYPAACAFAGLNVRGVIIGRNS